MRVSRSIGVALAIIIAAAAFWSAPAAEAKKKKKKVKSGPVVVATDPDGDWHVPSGAPIQPVGDATGQELLEATIDKPDKETLHFIIKVKALPPNGGTPEFVRYVWDVLVDDQLYELDGKWLNYTRGTCDPTAGTCPPPRNPGMQPFVVRTNCAPNSTVSNLITCEEVALVSAVFDPAAGTITIPVPMEAIGAKPGTKIIGGTNTVGGNISASPSAFFSTANIPAYDTMVMTKTYVVPR